MTFNAEIAQMVSDQCVAIEIANFVVNEEYDVLVERLRHLRCFWSALNAKAVRRICTRVSLAKHWRKHRPAAAHDNGNRHKGGLIP
jgi:hypothetical protein